MKILCIIFILVVLLSGCCQISESPNTCRDDCFKEYLAHNNPDDFWEYSWRTNSSNVTFCDCKILKNLKGGIEQ